MRLKENSAFDNKKAFLEYIRYTGLVQCKCMISFLPLFGALQEPVCLENLAHMRHNGTHWYVRSSHVS